MKKIRKGMLKTGVGKENNKEINEKELKEAQEEG